MFERLLRNYKNYKYYIRILFYNNHSYLTHSPLEVKSMSERNGDAYKLKPKLEIVVNNDI